jgi:hypothetical protein
MSVKTLTTAFATSILTSGIFSTALAQEANDEILQNQDAMPAQDISVKSSKIRPVLSYAGIGAAHDYYTKNEEGEYRSNTVMVTLYPGVVGVIQPNGTIGVDVVPAYNVSMQREQGDDNGYAQLSASVNYISKHDIWQGQFSFALGKTDIEAPRVLTALGFGEAIDVVKGVTGTYDGNIGGNVYVSAASYEAEVTTKTKLTLGYNNVSFARLDYSKEWHGLMGVQRMSALAGGFGYIEDTGSKDTGVYSRVSLDIGSAANPDDYQFFVGYDNSAEAPETFTAGVSISLSDGGKISHEFDTKSSARRTPNRLDIGMQKINGENQLIAGIRRSF